MSTNIQDQVNNMQSWTNMMKGDQLKKNGASQEMGQDAFLMLMMEQLKYQDPLKPVGNTEFLSQQAQFTQVSELQKLNSSLNTNNQVVQACTLIGKNVQLLNPEDTTKTIEGKVESVTFTGGAAQIVVNGKEYPLGLVMGIADQPIKPPSTGEGEGTEDKEEKPDQLPS